MKIAIIGSYGGSSIGDEAILRGLLKMLSVYSFKIKKVYVFTYNISRTNKAIDLHEFPFDIELINTRGKDLSINTNNEEVRNINKNKQFLIKMWLHLNRKIPSLNYLFLKMQLLSQRESIHKEILTNVDIILFGGGNLLMDLYPAWIDYLGHLYKLVEKGRNRIYFLGVGAGPLSTTKGKELIKKLGETCYISVRDIESKNLLGDLGLNKVKIGTDLAIGNYQYNDNNPYKRNGVGVTVVPYFSDFYWPESKKEYYINYKINMANILDSYIEKSKKEIEFFATNYPVDITVAKEIKAIMKNKEKVKILDKEMTVVELIDYIGSKDLILGTRLHSLILSYITKTSFFAFNYQPKVNYFLNRLSKGKDFIDIRELRKYALNRDTIDLYTNKIIINDLENREDIRPISLLHEDISFLKSEIDNIFN